MSQLDAPCGADEAEIEVLYNATRHAGTRSWADLGEVHKGSVRRFYRGARRPTLETAARALVDAIGEHKAIEIPVNLYPLVDAVHAAMKGGA